ncbi:hypothetical protein WR25_03873 [Diploscapter pachys]|uniref:Uncharacterized protein n=1 Tax=Diploscapter pachys TaxID=2018661 RepID=A0A2A2JMV0_9BILA|nr:hypothetical protein WR25_03873 [Diploscapter pachys]
MQKLLISVGPKEKSSFVTFEHLTVKMQFTISLAIVCCSLAALIVAQQMSEDEMSADKRMRSFAFAKRSPYRSFAFAKRSIGDSEAQIGEEEADMEKRARFAFAKRSPYRSFAFAKRSRPYGFAFA